MIQLDRRRLTQGLVGLPLLALASQAHASSGDLRFASLEEARQALLRWQQGGGSNSNPPAGPVSLHQMLHHCAQSLEYGLSGFPELKPAWFRASIGPAAAQVFLWRGKLSHDLADPIPGAPALAAQGDMAAAFARVFAAIDAFSLAVRNNTALMPHFAYGDVAPADYARLQAFHIAQHMEPLGARPA